MRTGLNYSNNLKLTVIIRYYETPKLTYIWIHSNTYFTNDALIQKLYYLGRAMRRLNCALKLKELN